MKSKVSLFLLLGAVYVLLSYVLLFRDLWMVEVIATKFYPQLAMEIFSLTNSLATLKLNVWPTLVFLMVVIGMFLTYWRLRAMDRFKTISLTVGFLGLVFFSYPILSSDILSYILSDRIAEVYHQNVWTTKPNAFTNDPYYYAVYPIYKATDWTNMTRIYGGINQAIFSPVTGITTRHFGSDLIANILSHKLVVFMFTIGTIGILALLKKPMLGLIVLNPLFLIETVGSGHNDIIMLFFALLAVFFYKKSNYLLAGVMLGLSTQVKTTPVLLFYFLAQGLISELKIRGLLKFSSAYIVIVLAIYFLMGVNPIYTISRTAGSINVLWQSLPSVVSQFFPSLKPLLSVGLLFFVLWQSLRVLIFRLDPIRIYVQTLLVYLLFFLAAFWNWYPIWLFVFLPFLSDNRLTNSIIGLTFSSMLAYGVMWLGYRFGYSSGLIPAIMYLTVLSGPAVGYAISKKIQE